jgi:hypothetical protein
LKELRWRWKEYRVRKGWLSSDKRMGRKSKETPVNIKNRHGGKESVILKRKEMTVSLLYGERI